MTATTRGSEQWRARVAEGKRREAASARKRREYDREAARLRPVDLARFEELGLVPERLRHLVARAGEEVAELVAALGGEAELSPQRRILLDDCARLGVALNIVMQLLLQGDAENPGELASRVATLANARRQHLVTIGLNKYERDAFGFSADGSLNVTWGDEASPSASDTNGSTPEAQAAPGDDRAQARSEEVRDG